MPEKINRQSILIRVRFITVMQQYSGQKELDMSLPEDPGEAVAMIVRQFRIPWAGRLEKSIRVFINKELLEIFAGSGRKLAEGDRISFIPMSDGG